MTELETLQRAKMYIDKLANGVNPLDDTPVPDGEAINNVRLSRCFFYISDILRQVIENGGTIGKAAKPQKVPFSSSYDQLCSFPYSDTPISVSEIARRISALSSEVRDNGMKSFKPQSINVFLLNAGFLEEVETSAGKKTKRPTETGRALGILMDSRTGPNGSYTVVVYNREAQQFVIDNIDAVLTIDRR